ncbi:MAG: UvrD-helicase domain-containing protein [Candidatus Aminicenantes bacterium]|nr:UvrD-helicase domain-containing protein [Candidatus Aminicenantes bacterium]
MKYIADFHIHSHFSRATSSQLVPEYLEYWARLKGITVVGAGDFTHPGWTKELKEKLEPAPTEPGLFKLKKEYKDKSPDVPFLPDAPVRFMLTAEISNIYKKNDRVRKVHNVIFAPDFATVDKIQQKLTGLKANITSDGRPILGMDSRDLLELVLNCSPDNFFIPAHIWTPWFSILGSKSGFDSVEECYADLSQHIYAVETGLSTDPPMNWMCRFLDKYTLVSNSDAHSPERLGRNANCFTTELSYQAITRALKTGDPRHFGGTIDLFPQEGKYHYDGHRKCDICWDPVQTLKHHNLCSVCGKPVTVGVMNRVVQLSDRENLEERPNRAPFYSIIPLKEILGEIAGVGPNSRKVDAQYMTLLKKGRPELEFLLEVPVEEIEKTGGPKLAEAVRRMRSRQVKVKEGYDGEYGVITVFHKEEAGDFQPTGQGALFKDMLATGSRHTLKTGRRELIDFDQVEYRLLQKQKTQEEMKEVAPQVDEVENGLNPEQWAAVRHFNGPALVIAGPGTGKTRVLTRRIAHLILERGIDPQKILAVTFTNKAAAEIRERLEQVLEKNSRPQVTTFHSLGYAILREIRGNAPTIIDPEDKKRLLQYNLGCEKPRVNQIADAITQVKQQLQTADHIGDETLAGIFRRYQARLEELNAVDLEDLIYIPVRLFTADAELRDFYRKKYQWIMVDEYQDVNLAQYRLIRLLAPGGTDGDEANLCVIGDPDQAIYGFRGADVRFINAFQEDYPNAELFRLKKSYRCTDSILRASGHVIKRNLEDSRGPDLEGMSGGLKIKIAENSSDKSEAEYVARTIEEMMGGLRFFSMDSSITQGNQEAEIRGLADFVVLCRVKAQMDCLEKAFNHHSIPYQVIGETPFFQQEPVKTVIDLLKLSINPANEFLKEQLIDKKIITPPDLPTLKTTVAQQLDVRGALNAVITIVEDRFPGEKVENEAQFKRLIQAAEPFQSQPDGKEALLKFAALGAAVDTYQPQLENVALMTLHAAKGLEFKCVFIVGCEDGLLPYSLFEQRQSDVEEERRLLYVGMTRAKKFLFLSHAGKRRLGGRQYHLKRSPFLDNIEKELIEAARQEPKRKDANAPLQRSLFD